MTHRWILMANEACRRSGFASCGLPDGNLSNFPEVWGHMNRIVRSSRHLGIGWGSPRPEPTRTSTAVRRCPFSFSFWVLPVPEYYMPLSATLTGRRVPVRQQWARPIFLLFERFVFPNCFVRFARLPLFPLGHTVYGWFKTVSSVTCIFFRLSYKKIRLSLSVSHLHVTSNYARVILGTSTPSDP
jgi:hypothetical protein